LRANSSLAEVAIPLGGPAYEALFQLAPDAILVIDEAGQILQTNERVDQMFGYTKGDLIGQSVDALVPDRSRAAHSRQRAAFVQTPRRRRMGEGLDLLGRRRDGSEFPVEIALAPIPTGRQNLVLAIIRDATLQKETEHSLERRVQERTRQLIEANRRLVQEQAKLVHAEKLSSIGLLASGVAHEINNPLSGVMGLVNSLREGSVPPDRRQEYFDTIREGLERMRLTVQGLLDFARQRPPSRSAFDVAAVAGACIRLVAPAAARKNVRLDLQIREKEIEIQADRSQIMHAIVNILLNAIYASRQESTVTVTAPREPGRVGIRISDQGEGIPKANLHRVVDPFFTTKPEGEGTGLGLAITLGIARGHEGDLTVESEEGRGTVVTLWLPLNEGSQSHA
jgi:PAS domain S-box-containing protein